MFMKKKDSILSLVEEFDLNPEETFYVGDTPRDVQAGKTAKVKTIGISWGFQHKNVLAKSKPDFLIDNILKIKSII